MEEHVSTPRSLVVVGSSAGGVEALSILVKSLPQDFPAPIVLAQHLDPNRPSTLDAILQRGSSLPVHVVNDRTVLQPGTIYVVPANRHVAIYDGHVEVMGDHARRPRPSIDLLFSTAAEIFGEHLIAVILTGSGSDGAAGAVDVKNAGGTVIVQSPESARYPSMPLALPPTVIDFEVDMERIGPLLQELLAGTSLAPAEEKTEDVLRSILELVSRQASIDFSHYKPSTILRRIGRRMTITHCRTMRDYLEFLRSYPEEVGELVKSFLINVTQFFRDPEAFTYLRDEILPKLIARGRSRDRILRFWAAGCATGEEAYSLAMLVTDLLGAELPEWSVKIFATDLDEAAVAFAKRGLYTASLLKGLPADYVERFFERTDHAYRISKTLRQMVIFGQQDLSRSAPFPHIDLILCRNVLIYFTPELQDYVLNQFAFSLAPDGYLFLGKAETVRPSQSYYELVNKQWKVYRCIGSPLHAMQSPPQALEVSKSRYERQANNRLPRLGGKLAVEQEIPAPTFDMGQLQRFNELFLRFLPVGILVIDRNYHILTANGTARRVLGLRDMATGQDFLHAVHGIPYTEVRSAIDTVFRERNTVTLPEVELDIATGGSGRFLLLSIAPMQLEAGAPELAAISVHDVTEQVQTRRQLEATQAEQAHLMNELSTANKRLNEVNKELLDANEELQVANEELVLTHEELQASIEEFETTNEELQATNEELETNNEELQATNEELETTNEELRARTSELQELTTTLESERKRLNEMVELSPFYIMVLRGPNLLIEAFNRRYAGLLEDRNVQGRPLEVVFELFWRSGIPIVRMAHEVYEKDVVRVTPRILTRIQQASGETTESYFVYTLVPSHDANGKVSGVIIYAVDETAQRANEAEEERGQLRLIFANARGTALALYNAHTAELMMASPYYLDTVARLWRLDRNSLVGRKWQDINVIESTQELHPVWDSVLKNRTALHVPEVHFKVLEDSQEREIVWDYNIMPIFSRERPGEINYILVSAVDITRQTQARREMERLNRLKDDFTSMASHELRTPLTSIKGNAELLQRQLEHLSEAEKQKSEFKREQEIIQRIIHQATRLDTMLNEMMDLTRLQSEQLELHPTENLDIVDVVRRVVENQEAVSQREIRLETKQDSLRTTGDEARLEQVLSNLISNAIKYSPADRPVTVAVDRADSEAIISVRDEGSGISKEEQAHIFERYYRAHSDEDGTVQGLGLGLYIAHEIVERMGGRMWLESQPGKGSTFYFSLPLQS